MHAHAPSGAWCQHADMGNTFMDKLDSIEEDAIQNDSDPDANKQQASSLPQRLYTQSPIHERMQLHTNVLTRAARAHTVAGRISRFMPRRCVERSAISRARTSTTPPCWY